MFRIVKKLASSHPLYLADRIKLNSSQLKTESQWSVVVYVNPSLSFNCIRGVIAEALHKHVDQIWTTVVSVNVVTFWSEASIGCKFDPTCWIKFLLPPLLYSLIIYLFIYFLNFLYNNFYHKLAIGRLEPLTSPLLYFIIISFCMALWSPIKRGGLW